MPTSPIATTRNPAPIAGVPGTTSWTGDMSPYTIPQTNLGTTTATQMVGEPLQATIAATPALQRVADIVSAINQRSWMSAPGRTEQLANIQRWQRGELDPEVYAQEASQAAQTYGTGGFGVDSPAWQAAIRRALVLNRQALQEKAGTALAGLYEGMPETDVQRYTLTPSDYATALDQQRARQLELAQLQQRGALESASLAQARALAEQELALKRQQYELARAKQAAELAASGFTTSGARIPGPTPSYSDWITQGYSRPTVYTELPIYTIPRRRND